MTNNQVYNNQIITNNQKPINQTGLGIGYWNLGFIWSLGFGYWLLFFMTLCLFASPAAQAAVGPNWIEQWGITWTFDKPITNNKDDPGVLSGNKYLYGTFVNDDYWVVGPVIITNVNPLPVNETSEVYVNDNGVRKLYRCKKTNTTTTVAPDFSALKPGSGVSWEEYWQYVKELSDGETARNGEWLPDRVYYSSVWLNGTMINITGGWPTRYLGQSKPFAQGFDSRRSNFDPGLCKIPPYTVTPNNSIISLVSIKPGDYYWTFEYGVPEVVIKTAAVLTVLDKSPGGAMFRPSYFGCTKKYLYEQEMDLSILPELDAVPDMPNYTVSSRYMERSWIPRIPGTQNDNFKAADNFPGQGYDNQPLAGALANMALLLLVKESALTQAPFNYPVGWKKDFSIKLAQFGIDMYGAMRENFGSGWTDGQIGHGNKWPILFAGMILDDNEMKGVGETFGYSADESRNHMYFMEDAQKFYVTQTDIDRWKTSNRIATRNNCRVNASDPTVVIDDSEKPWYISDAGTDIPARDERTNYDYCIVWNYGTQNEEISRIIGVNRDGIGTNKMRLRDPLTPGSGKTARVQLFPQELLGFPNWGERHPCNPEGDFYSRAYRYSVGKTICGPALAALSIKTRDGTKSGKDLWNWNAYFDYTDMYMQQNSGKIRYYSIFNEHMWDAYRANYGPVWPDKDTIAYGDISGDSALSAYDAALAARIAVGLDAYPTGDNLTKADVSGDGQVTAYDAALIAQKAVGLIDKFPVE